MNAICIQKKGAMEPVVRVATTSAPSVPPKYPLVSRSQAKKYRSTHTKTASIFAKLTMLC